MTVAEFLQIALAIYLAIGIYMATLGPFSRDLHNLWQEGRRLRGSPHAIDGDVDKSTRPVATWKLAAAIAIMGLITTLGWLLFLLDEHLRSSTAAKRRTEVGPQGAGAGAKVDLVADESAYLVEETPEIFDEPEIGLRFARMPGGGNVTCHACGHVESVTSSLHGFGTEPWIQKDHQCLNCRAFVTVTIPFVGAASPERCDCGGELTREGILKCPACGSEDIGYCLRFIT